MLEHLLTACVESSNHRLSQTDGDNQIYIIASYISVCHQNQNQYLSFNPIIILQLDSDQLQSVTLFKAL